MKEFVMSFEEADGWIQRLTRKEEIIRCRDCEYWKDQEEGVVKAPICARPEDQYEKYPFRFRKNPFRFIVGPDGFCNFAKRKSKN